MGARHCCLTALYCSHLAAHVAVYTQNHYTHHRPAQCKVLGRAGADTHEKPPAGRRAVGRLTACSPRDRPASLQHLPASTSEALSPHTKPVSAPPHSCFQACAVVACGRCLAEVSVAVPPAPTAPGSDACIVTGLSGASRNAHPLETIAVHAGFPRRPVLAMPALVGTPAAELLHPTQPSHPPPTPQPPQCTQFDRAALQPPRLTPVPLHQWPAMSARADTKSAASRRPIKKGKRLLA